MQLSPPPPPPTSGPTRFVALAIVGLTTLAATTFVSSASAADPQSTSPAPASLRPSCANGVTYTVDRGDTWIGIAGRVSVAVGALFTANDADESRILHPDDVLCLPAGADTSRLPARSLCAGPTAGTYTVASGDHWFGIARRAGVGVISLLNANSATEERLLHPGDVLCLPTGAASTVVDATTRSGAPATPAATAHAATSASGSCGDGSPYTVRSGDHWFGIAQRAGIGIFALLNANSTTQDRMLHPGDVLCLPAGATAGTTTSGATAASTTSSGTCSSDYTVRSGDSWYDIATAAGVGISSLYGVNEASERRVLHPGDVLCLPSGAAAIQSASRSTSTVAMQAMPTQGPCWFSDSWHAPRGGGRLHVGTDFFVHPGQYVYAVVDGTLTRRAWDQPGRRAGNAWWLTAADGSGTYYFYAHLSGFAPDLEVGTRVRAGQILGWVGATGNAAAPHLHFEVHPGGGAPINPYPLLRAQGGCNTGTPYEQPGGWIPSRIGP